MPDESPEGIGKDDRRNEGKHGEEEGTAWLLLLSPRTKIAKSRQKDERPPSNTHQSVLTTTIAMQLSNDLAALISFACEAVLWGNTKFLTVPGGH